MERETVNIIRGKEIEITELSLSVNDGSIKLLMKFYCDNILCVLQGYNISNFQIRNVSFPIEVGGFEFVDNQQFGWDKNCRYLFRDFEDDKLSFICENYDFAIIH